MITIYIERKENNGKTKSKTKAKKKLNAKRKTNNYIVETNLALINENENNFQ